MAAPVLTLPSHWLPCRYKTKIVDLSETRTAGEKISHIFCNTEGEGEAAATRGKRKKGGAAKGNKGPFGPASQLHDSNLDQDGLPHVGMRVQYGDSLYCTKEVISGKFKVRVWGVGCGKVQERGRRGREEGFA